MTDIKAIGCHVFMGGLTRGIAESLDVQAQYEIFTLGEKTVEHNLQIPFYQAEDADDWQDLVMDQHRNVEVVFGNPRCTGFSALGHGCSEDAHGAWSKPTIDIRQLAQLAAWIKPPVWCFESVQQAGTTGRELLDWLNQTYGEGYRFAELYHNAAQFGNAQHRRRVIFVWYRKDLQLPVEEITEQCLHRGPHVVVGDVLRPYETVEPLVVPSLDDFDTISKLEAASPWINDAALLNHHHKRVTDRHLVAGIATTVEGRGLNSVPASRLQEKWPDMADNRRYGISFSWHAPRRLHRHRASPVVYSASGKFIHPMHNRPLSVRELAALMGLPDDWAVLGPDPIAQLGKGVCVDVGRWLGKLLHACVTGETKRTSDLGAPHEIFRLDRDYGWVPKKPRIEAEGYGDEEDED